MLAARFRILKGLHWIDFNRRVGEVQYAAVPDAWVIPVKAETEAREVKILVCCDAVWRGTL